MMLNKFIYLEGLLRWYIMFQSVGEFSEVSLYKKSYQVDLSMAQVK